MAKYSHLTVWRRAITGDCRIYMVDCFLSCLCRIRVVVVVALCRLVMHAGGFMTVLKWNRDISLPTPMRWSNMVLRLKKGKCYMKTVVIYCASNAESYHKFCTQVKRFLKLVTWKYKLCLKITVLHYYNISTQTRKYSDLWLLTVLNQYHVSVFGI